MSAYESIFKKLPQAVRQIVLEKGMGPKTIQRNVDTEYAQHIIKEAKNPTGKKFRGYSEYKSGGQVKKYGVQMKGTSPLLKRRK